MLPTEGRAGCRGAARRSGGLGVGCACAPRTAGLLGRGSSLSVAPRARPGPKPRPRARAYRFAIIVVHQRVAAHARDGVRAVHGRGAASPLRQDPARNFCRQLALPFFSTIPSVAFSHMAGPGLANMQSRERPFLTRGGRGGGRRRPAGRTRLLSGS